MSDKGMKPDAEPRNKGPQDDELMNKEPEPRQMELEHEINILKLSINRVIEENPDSEVNSQEIMQLSKKLDELIRLYYRRKNTSDIG